MDNDQPDDAIRFELSAIVAGHAYPPSSISAEIGRVAIAAARVDRQLALVLLAVRYREPHEEVLKWQSGRLLEQVKTEIKELFEGAICDEALQLVAATGRALDRRHAVAHNIWTLHGPDATIEVSELLEAKSEEELDCLLSRDITSSDWVTLHPRANAPGPSSDVQLSEIRRQLERAVDALEELRFKLASALFSGSPAGAKRVLPLRPDAGGPRNRND